MAICAQRYQRAHGPPVRRAPSNPAPPDRPPAPACRANRARVEGGIARRLGLPQVTDQRRGGSPTPFAPRLALRPFGLAQDEGVVGLEAAVMVGHAEHAPAYGQHEQQPEPRPQRFVPIGNERAEQPVAQAQKGKRRPCPDKPDRARGARRYRFCQRRVRPWRCAPGFRQITGGLRAPHPALALFLGDQHLPRIIGMAHLAQHRRALLPGLRPEILAKPRRVLQVQPADTLGPAHALAGEGPIAAAVEQQITRPRPAGGVVVDMPNLAPVRSIAPVAWLPRARTASR